MIEAGRLHAFIGAIGTLNGLQGTGAPIEYFSTDDFAPVPGQVYIAARDAVAKEPETIVRYLRGVRQAVDAMLADEPMDKTIELLANFEIAALKDPAIAKADLKANKALWLSAGSRRAAAQRARALAAWPRPARQGRRGQAGPGERALHQRAGRRSLALALDRHPRAGRRRFQDGVEHRLGAQPRPADWVTAWCAGGCRQAGRRPAAPSGCRRPPPSDRRW
ncbi:MAG: hypothetical protein WDO24_09710 [Pseudomonadota bacterium]